MWLNFSQFIDPLQVKPVAMPGNPFSPSNQVTARKSSELKRRISRVDGVVLPDLPSEKRFIRSVGELDFPDMLDTPAAEPIITERESVIPVDKEDDIKSIMEDDEAVVSETLIVATTSPPAEVEDENDEEQIPPQKEVSEIAVDTTPVEPVVASSSCPTGAVTPVISPASRAAPDPPPNDHVCYVCRRRLGSADMLKKHEELSALHEKNLRLLRMAHQKKRIDLRNDVIRLRYLGATSPQTEAELRKSETELGETQQDLEDECKSSTRSEATVCIGNQFELHMSGVSWTGNKPTNEDRILLGFSINDFVKGTLIADGHCGDTCADYLIENMVDCIRAELGEAPVTAEAVTEALRSACRKTDEKFIEFAIANQNPSGSTCVLTLFFIDSQAGVLISVTAHAGDSRAVVRRTVDDPTVVRVTQDHKPDRSDEKVRLINAGGHVVDVGGVWRVFTPTVVSIGGRALQWGLAVSRAFGDLALKRPVEIVTAEPELTTVTLSDDSIFVQACDGIYDVLSDEQTIEAALKGGPEGVLRAAYGKLSEDNLTAIVVQVKRRVKQEETREQAEFTQVREENLGQPPQMITPSQQVENTSN